MAEIENIKTSSAFDDPTLFGGSAIAPEDNEAPEHELDSEKSVELFEKLKNWLDQEQHRQHANRYQQALDEDYYDSMQWTTEDAQALLDRGQSPLVFNEIKPTIDWLIGTERRTRIDYKILPRRKESNDDALVKTDLMKYLSDTNKSPFHRSRAFDDAIKAGVGWIETGVHGDASNELLYTRYEDWRKVIYDSNSVETDLSDARYLFRWKWLDADIAKAYFPDRADALTIESHDPVGSREDDFYYMGARVTQNGTDYASMTAGKYAPYNGSAFGFNMRKRVKVVEAWYRMPKLKRMLGGKGELAGQQFNAENQEHIDAIQGDYSIYDKLEMEVRCAIFCDGGLLFDGVSPYKHERFPLVPVWCFRRKRDNAPYGIIRGLRDAQDDLNKRRSKALWILSSNRIIAEEGAVEDWDELREEASRPDSMIIKKAGKELVIDRDVQLANEHLQLMNENITHIRNIGGVTAENLGRQTNANSGIAIQSRQEQGGVVTTEPFDNLRLATQLVGEMELSNIEQFYTEPKVVRIVGERGGATFKEINQPQPDGSILNDVTKEQADFVVSEQDYKSTLRQAMFESLFDITSKLAAVNPQIAMNLLDLVVDSADIPNKDEIVARIRKLTGQRDPQAEPTPEEQQAMAAQEQLAQVQQEITQKTAEATLQELMAKSDNLDANSIMKRVEAMYAALQAAGIVATNPAAATIADTIMKGSGFKDSLKQEQEAQSAMIQDAAQQMQDNPQEIPQQQPSPNGMPPSALTGVTHGIQTPENEGA